MKILKKGLCLLLILALSVFFVVGCSGEGSVDPEGVGSEEAIEGEVQPGDSLDGADVPEIEDAP